MSIKRALLLFLFFLSGISALIYQMAWIRQMTLTFGVSVYAYSVVTATFMGGLALGSYCVSRFARFFLGFPLRRFGQIQIAIAGIGFVMPLLLRSLTPLYITFAQQMPMGSPLLTLLRALMALVVLLPPTLLMGATLPVLVQIFATNQGKIGSDVGKLYAADTLGAALGCAATGLFLLRLIGTQNTIWLAATINLLIAALTFVIALRQGEIAQNLPAQTISENVNRTESVNPKSQILILYAISGFTALAYEIVWARILTIFTLNAVYSYSIMLTTFLLGITIGGWVGTRRLKRRSATFVHFGNLQLLLALLVLFTFYIFWFIPNRITLEDVFGFYSLTRVILFEFLLGFLTLLLPTFVLGLLFPLATSLYTQEIAGNAGTQVGKLNAANTIGSLLGSLAAGFVFIPLIGLQWTGLLLAIINLALGFWAYWIASKLTLSNKTAVPNKRSAQPVTKPASVRKSSTWSIPGVASAIFVLFALLLPPGYYLGFRSEPGDNMVFYGEGIEAIVSVFDVPEQNFKVSFVNGRNEVPTDAVSMRAFRLLGHLPAILKPDAQNALMLSFGNGISTGSLDTHGIPQIDAVDLAAEQFQAAELYWQENYNVLRSAHLQTYVEDARNFLLQTDNTYDIITSDSTHPTNSSSWALFTVEFYTSVARHLNPEGVFMQWLPYHNLRQSDYKMILRTFQQVFPNATLWYTGGSHTLMLATPQPLSKQGLTQLAQTVAENQIVIDDLGSAQEWIADLAMDSTELSAYTGSGELNTDDRAFFLPYDSDNEIIQQALEAAVN